MGWSVVGMTGHPEAVLARELGLCYTSMTLVTDLDAGAETGEGVSHEEVLKVFAANVDRLRAVLFDAVAGLPAERDAGLSCARVRWTGWIRGSSCRKGCDRGLVLARAWSWFRPGPGSGLVLVPAWSWFRPGPGSGLVLIPVVAPRGGWGAGG